MAAGANAFQTKNSFLAIVRETTVGVPVKPTAGTDYIALQDGFNLEPVFETLENAELTGSLGPAKPIQGLENPTSAISHYIRHSGVEGQEPNFGLLIESAFGDKVIASTEFDTVAGSTAGTATAPATINVDTGEGVNFERGQALLIKDGANVFAMRNVKSVAGDILTLNFNLDNAPGVGVNLGKAVLYKPGQSHPCMSLWSFRANDFAIELIAGALVTELGIEIGAGELINGSFDMEGVEFFFNPIVIDATNDSMDFNDGGGEENVTVTQKTYKDPHELADTLATAMNAATGDTITVVYSDKTGKFTIASDGGTLSLLWATGTATATTIGDEIGFDTSADDTGSTSYIGDNAISFKSFQTPVFDNSDPLAAKNNEVFMGDFADNVCFQASTMTYTLSNEKTDKNEVCAVSGKSGSVITGRTATIEMVAFLDKFDVDKWRRFRENETTELAYNFGVRSGGNWVAGKCGSIYFPSATITSFNLGDQDGLVVVNMTLTAFVDSSGNGENYLNFN